MKRLDVSSSSLWHWDNSGYLPPKTMKKNPRKVEVETPIMKFALEIMKRCPMPFAVLKSMGNKNDYNHKIRHLLEFCGIDRPVQQFNHELKANEYFPLYTLASSSICRSTNEEIMKKVQISMYTSGLHKVGSKAIEHYYINHLRNRIAHHEPICFDANDNIDTFYVESRYKKMIMLLGWMGIDSGTFLYALDHVDNVCQQINKLK